MAKTASALLTVSLVRYIEKHYPEVSFVEILKDINSRTPYFVKNLKTDAVELVAIDHISDPNYWFSNLFMIDLYNALEARIPDPDLPLEIGKASSKARHILKTAVGIPLLGPRGVLKIIERESRKYTTSKKTTLLKSVKGYCKIRLECQKNIIINEFSMKWHGGVFIAYAEMAGATDVSIKIKCIEKGPSYVGDVGNAIWEFELFYKEPNIIKRLFKSIIFNIPIVKNEIEKAHEIQADHNKQLRERDKIIVDKTKEMMKIEKRFFEAKLQKMSAEMTFIEERERRTLAENLHDTVAQTLAIGVSKLKTLNQEKPSPEFKELMEIQKTFEHAIEEVRSLTFQISPPILYTTGIDAALEWLAHDFSEKHGFQVDFTNDFSNIIGVGNINKTIIYRAVRELFINTVKHANAQKVTLSITRSNEFIVINYGDNGVGYDRSLIDSRKSHFGLSNIAERINALNGTVDIDSKSGKGTTVCIMVPLRMEDPMQSVFEN